MQKKHTDIHYVVSYTDKDGKHKKRYFSDIEKFKEFKNKLKLQRICYCEYKV